MDDPLVGFVAVVSQRAAFGQAARAAALGKAFMAGDASTHLTATQAVMVSKGGWAPTVRRGRRSLNLSC
jgi:hypothetical protein